MQSYSVCADWMYWYCVLHLAWWWLDEPKHVADFIILITNIRCVYWLNKFLHYCKTQWDGSYQNVYVFHALALVISLHLFSYNFPYVLILTYLLCLLNISEIYSVIHYVLFTPTHALSHKTMYYSFKLY
jgi:hypothetical protein